MLISLPVFALNKSAFNSITSDSPFTQQKERFVIMNLLKKIKSEPTPEPKKTTKKQQQNQKTHNKNKRGDEQGGNPLPVLRAGSPTHSAPRNPVMLLQGPQRHSFLCVPLRRLTNCLRLT